MPLLLLPGVSVSAGLYLGWPAVLRMLLAVVLSRGRAVLLRAGTGAAAPMRITKLPMPIQKAMARPATSPTTAP